MEVAVVGIALNHAFNSRPIDPAAKRQNIASLCSNHQMLVVNRAFHAPRLVRPLEMPGDHIPLLLQFKKLRRGASVRVFAVQSPLTRDVGRQMLRWRLLREQKTTAEDHQSKTKHQNPQAISLHYVLLAPRQHSKIYSNSRPLSSCNHSKDKWRDKILIESRSRIPALQHRAVHRKDTPRLCPPQQLITPSAAP